jgi:hypothetical protein
MESLDTTNPEHMIFVHAEIQITVWVLSVGLEE